MKKKTIVIAGGGTGGHLYPGLALVERLKQQEPDVEVHFVGAQGGLEEKIIPHEGYPLHLLSVGRLHHSVGLLRRFKALLLLPLSFIQSFLLYLRLKPRWVLGVGGFASGPFVFTASLLGGRTAVLEPNAYPGLANKLLSKVVRFCFVVFEETSQFFPSSKVHSVGLPVRVKKQKPEFQYKNNRPLRVLVFGGSQGSRAINQFVIGWVESLGENSKNYEIFHQIGSRDFEVEKARYQNQYDSFLEYTDYIHNMPEKLQWADLVICRAGIGSVAEIAMCGKPTLFIPLPTAADNHQVKNAQVLVNKNAAFMIEEKDLNSEVLGKFVESLRAEPNKMKAAMDNLTEVDYTRAPVEILKVLQGSL